MKLTQYFDTVSFLKIRIKKSDDLGHNHDFRQIYI